MEKCLYKRLTTVTTVTGNYGQLNCISRHLLVENKDKIGIKRGRILPNASEDG